ncbi:DNA cytosine methyltransferase [Macrococcoides caseolyticum]|uniref:DNA (Cytosine-5-)-methyltransferase n=1 Tax=Macrococcoides caseolyticum TaxID=69966 RepID=A0ACC9MR81_9STAP|nr:DNA cytosine methyltransferase [Macrococcus caseolyticus]PKE39172.1 DNA (cytosine-5-)-methyltransferase [Macrococcus caseolyticus]PKE56218.1 DNA (cytosine-5-)-methyltransferase [Macrococcus caseolyticus]
MNNVISIFSGGGGIDLGFKLAGFDILFASDFNKDATETLKYNKSANLVINEDIRNLDYSEIMKFLGSSKDAIDVIVGGPPCPAYSKSRFYRKDKKRALDDENSFTLFEYFRALEEIKPKVFLFENVAGFTFKPHKPALDALIKTAKDLGYNMTYRVLNAADYGVPQMRERFIAVGVRKDLDKSFIFPESTHYNPEKADLFDSNGNKKPWITCAEAIGDLDYDLPEDEKMQAGSKDKELLKLIPPGENYLYLTEKRGYPDPKFEWRSRYWSFLLKLSPEKPSWTIQASFSNNQGPFHWKNRFLRISEIKRLQTFPDDYNFQGDFKSQWRQIGNAVPPKLIEVLAKEIQRQIL